MMKTINQAHYKLFPQKSAAFKKTALLVNKRVALLSCSGVVLMGLLTGCSTTISNITGSEPVGVMAGDRTIAQRLRDGGIEKTALVNLYKLDDRFEKRSRISVDAFHDVVLITGQVPDPHLKQLATDSIKAIPEVKLVHNELAIAPEATYQQIVQDGMIKASISKNLLMLPYMKSSRVKVAVEQGVVYIMGVLSEEETTRVLQTVQQTDGIVKIISLIDIQQNTIPIGDATGIYGPYTDKTAMTNTMQQNGTSNNYPVNSTGQYADQISAQSGGEAASYMPQYENTNPSPVYDTNEDVTPQAVDPYAPAAPDKQETEKEGADDTHEKTQQSADLQLEPEQQTQVITRELTIDDPEQYQTNQQQ